MRDEFALLLAPEQRQSVWEYLISSIEHYLVDIPSSPVAPLLSVEQTRAFVSQYDFAAPLDPSTVIEQIVKGLWQHQVHTPHPRYFGLFNPAPTTMGIVADALVATFNPQLAAWSHSPLAVEIESHLIHCFGTRFGYGTDQIDGTFTSGGAEANHTALLTALVNKFPEFSRNGLRALTGQPVFYVSSQSHHSLIKAARFCGLGSDAVREVPIDTDFRMDVDKLRAQIILDKQAGMSPFLIVATAGTTNAGLIDPIQQIADLAEEQGLWLHVDAAWGGLAIMVPELRQLLAGIERADSITFDAHKGLSIPMSAGMYLTRHQHILEETCRITTDYMPRDLVDMDITDPFVHSMQWSRRFIGLKVFLSLAVAGWDGYARVIRHQVEMGDLLRHELEADGWSVVNKTPLPVICFTDPSSGNNPQTLDNIATHIVQSGLAWLSPTRLNPQTPVLRACITNYRSQPDDVVALVKLLRQAREKL